MDFEKEMDEFERRILPGKRQEKDWVDDASASIGQCNNEEGFLAGGRSRS